MGSNEDRIEHILKFMEYDQLKESIMDPIETWHDAPEFERMDAKIKALEGKLAALVETAERVLNSIYGWNKAIEAIIGKQPQSFFGLEELKAAIEAAKEE